MALIEQLKIMGPGARRRRGAASKVEADRRGIKYKSH